MDDTPRGPRLILVVSGLPASGKSTVGRGVADLLALPFLDKDDILESLFEAEGVGDAAWRARLSRRADELFAQRAAVLESGVLVSWWRHPAGRTDTGTPTDWIPREGVRVVELHCACPAPVAAARFAARTRHRGHLDHARNEVSLRAEFEQLAALGPLGIGPVIQVPTDGAIDFAGVVAALRS
jgi:predicted kinase